MDAIVLFKEASFDEHATRVMGEAFDSACFSLREFGRSDFVHEIIAKRIIEAAKNGERDPDRLHAQALKVFAPRMAKKPNPAGPSVQKKTELHA